MIDFKSIYIDKLIFICDFKFLELSCSHLLVEPIMLSKKGIKDVQLE